MNKGIGKFITDTILHNCDASSHVWSSADDSHLSCFFSFLLIPPGFSGPWVISNIVTTSSLPVPKKTVAASLHFSYFDQYDTGVYILFDHIQSDKSNFSRPASTLNICMNNRQWRLVWILLLGWRVGSPHIYSICILRGSSTLPISYR